jgi:hypothetical protein
MALARLLFLFLLVGQDGFHHVAGLGDVRKIDFGSNGLRAARRRAAALATRPRPTLKQPANLLRFVILQ